MTTDANVATATETPVTPTAEAPHPELERFTDPNEPAAPAPAPAKTETPAEGAEGATKAEGEGEGTGQPSEGEGGEQPKPKPKKTAEQRIGEITSKFRDAERERDELRRELEGLKKPKGGDAPTETRTLANGEPDATKYEYGEADPNYIRDLARFETRQVIALERETERRNAQVQEVDRSWETAQAAARSKYADYDEVVTEGAANGEWPCSPAMAHAIKTSETGPDVAYHLATHPDEARRIAGMSEFSQIREMGRLEARLSTPPTKEPPKGKTATDAPPPPEGAARGAGGKFVVSDDTDDFAAFRAKHFSP